MVSPHYMETVAGEPGRPMSDSEVADVIASFARSARWAMEIGFDGIAIHGAHGYMIDNFLWGGTNRRTDRWGGDHLARPAFAAEPVRPSRSEKRLGGEQGVHAV